jgi:ABC-type antimicrobial peptide transport system permease subunit
LLGLGLALLAAQLLQALMFETSPHDSASLAGGALAVLLGAMLAAWWPARQAARIAPMQALRQD